MRGVNKLQHEAHKVINLVMYANRSSVDKLLLGRVEQGGDPISAKGSSLAQAAIGIHVFHVPAVDWLRPLDSWNS